MFGWSCVLKDMFLCELLQAAHGGLLELHQTLAGTRILHLDLPLTLLCRDTGHRQETSADKLLHYFHLMQVSITPGGNAPCRLMKHGGFQNHLSTLKSLNKQKPKLQITTLFCLCLIRLYYSVGVYFIFLESVLLFLQLSVEGARGQDFLQRHAGVTCELHLLHFTLFWTKSLKKIL